jgi:hypothetical protein
MAHEAYAPRDDDRKWHRNPHSCGLGRGQRGAVRAPVAGGGRGTGAAAPALLPDVQDPASRTPPPLMALFVSDLPYSCAFHDALTCLVGTWQGHDCGGLCWWFIGCGWCRGLGRRGRGPSRGAGAGDRCIAPSLRGTGASTPAVPGRCVARGPAPRLCPVVPGHGGQRPGCARSFRGTGASAPAVPGRSGARGPAPCSSRVTGALDPLFAIR